MVAVLPIAAKDLPEACRFLARGFQASDAQDAWMAAFSQSWAEHQPNHGYMLQDKGQIVGVIGAIYSDQMIRGRHERFCNVNNWYVDPAYRQHSILLLSRLLTQKGVHFTNLTPRADLLRLFTALKFQYVDDGRVIYILNVPQLRLRDSKVLTDPDEIVAVLSWADAKVFRDHVSCLGLKQVALGSKADGFCHVAFCKTTVRRIPCITILHISNPMRFSRHLPALRRHFLRYGAPLAQVESRLLSATPHLAIELKRAPHKMFLSHTLAPGDVTSLYTELAAMHANRPV